MHILSRERNFSTDVLNKLSLQDEHYNGKYFNKLVEFLIDELPNIGEEQPFEGSVCDFNLSSSSMDEDVDENQTHSEADSNAEPEDDGSDFDDDSQSNFGAYLNVDLESNADAYFCLLYTSPSPRDS